MAAIVSSVPGLDSAHLVRGSQRRIADHKEQLHRGVFKAMVAAAGCTYSVESVDQGNDIAVHHQINSFIDSLTINFQLKCTEGPITPSGKVVVKVSEKRYNDMRHEGKNAPFLLVAQHVVDDQDRWVDFSGDNSVFGVKNYWLNLTGAVPRNVSTGEVEVRVPTSQVLDDNQLIQLFAQARKGVLKK
ncbi:DUF4365 domain-containing protein [Corynebacterium accolens]|uniref:DUF4365 domain-containing protein n=1 Tax=Corynebacterium accolens TaxID=38284 RepID=UPI002543C35B|nr:DUF4365 domain-containing protein [Corynebacterium accolens]MDK4265844.1 DUF4365 domain-containing protein [Corynebacterium accolens]MDK4308707.1 DUF4365 domain-containing protein [Corynebacterium accolens]